MGDIDAILAEVSDVAGRVESTQLEGMVDAILRARRIFVSGAGRSGLMIRALANRLMHLGLTVSVIGEISAPHTQPGDLLLVGSGSGETASLVSQARAAKAAGMDVALLTANADSTLAGLATSVVVLPAQTKQSADDGAVSVQPMGSTFEQASLIVYDALVLELMRRSGETAESMKNRHADLE